MHSRTSVYNIIYHVVRSVKYRRKIITNKIEDELWNMAFRIADERSQGHYGAMAF